MTKSIIHINILVSITGASETEIIQTGKGKTMSYTQLDLYGLTLSENGDGTYKGTKEKELYDMTTNQTHMCTLEYPRLLIKWKDNIECGIIESIEILQDVQNNGAMWKVDLKD